MNELDGFVGSDREGIEIDDRMVGGRDRKFVRLRIIEGDVAGLDGVAGRKGPQKRLRKVRGK